MLRGLDKMEKNIFYFFFKGKIEWDYELTGLFLIAFAITPPISPHNAAKPVTKTIVTSQA